MKKTLSLISLFILFQGILFSQTITLSGYIKDKITQKPIDGVAVEVVDLITNKKYITQSYLLGNWSVDVTRINDFVEKPTGFSLDQNFPNPFNPSTKIGFKLEDEGNVNLLVHNILGQELDKKSFYCTPGFYSIDWFSKGSSGVLFYTIETRNKRITKKMMQLDGGKGGWGSLSKITIGDLSHDVIKIPKTGMSNYKIAVSMLGYMPDSITINQTSGSIDFNIETVHNNSFVFDLHNDLLEATESETYNWGERHTKHHTDIPRLIEGGIDAQMFVIWCQPETDTTYFTKSMNFYKTFTDQVKLNESKIGQAKNENEILELNRNGKIAGVIIAEGGHAIESKMENLIKLYNIGARYLTITWNNSTSWAVSASDNLSKTKGLSEFGKQVIRTMDSLGMLIDIAHTGVKTIEDILSISKNPIMDSHAGAYSIRNSTRNLTDDQIKAIAANGGVIGVVFYPSFLGTGRVDIDQVIKHIDYIKNLVGIDYISLGSDFDGIESVPVGLEDVSKLPNLTMTLLKKGYSIQDVKKILGENFMRVFRKVCK